MKYKIIGITVVLLAVLISVVVPSVFKEGDSRFIQHESALLRPEDEVDDGTFNSHLPLVVIDTEGQTIPGESLGMKDEDGFRMYTTSEDGSKTINVSFTVLDNESRYNNGEAELCCNRLDDTPDFETRAEMRIRGKSSRLFDKKGYLIRFVTEEGKNNPHSVMGMTKHHEWILHGPFLDKTLIRNYLFYNLGGLTMEYSPNVRFCEVFIDGEYEGVYLMTERVSQGSRDGGRIDVTVNKKNDTFSGYILRVDEGSTNKLANINVFSEYALDNESLVEIVFPGTTNLSENMANKIRVDFSDFEKALYSYDFDDDKYGFMNRVDVDSFVNYYLINELTSNYDAGSYSTYIYKGTDNKYRMCIWDFNNCCDNYQEQAVNRESFVLNDRLWFSRMMLDRKFVDNIISRYKALRKSYYSDEYLNGFIDGAIDYLGPAIDRNFEKWGYSFESTTLLVPAERNAGSYEEAVEDLKQFLTERTDWMDRNIESLRQYCSESKIKKFKEDAN